MASKESTIEHILSIISEKNYYKKNPQLADFIVKDIVNILSDIGEDVDEDEDENDEDEDEDEDGEDTEETEPT